MVMLLAGIGAEAPGVGRQFYALVAVSQSAFVFSGVSERLQPA
jgi:hypothetical protein